MTRIEELLKELNADYGADVVDESSVDVYNNAVEKWDEKETREAFDRVHWKRIQDIMEDPTVYHGQEEDNNLATDERFIELMRLTTFDELLSETYVHYALKWK